MYTAHIDRLSKHLKLYDSVKGTAIMYFKRFCLHNSFWSVNAQHLFKACVFLACKAEEINLTMARFCESMKGTDPEKIIEYESMLVGGMKFQLTVYTPYRSLRGFLAHLEEQGLTVSEEDQQKCANFIDA